MSIQIAIPVLVTFLHNLFTAIWIGGLIILATIVFPAMRKQNEQDKELSNSIQKRLNKIVLVSIVGLWITGMLLANRSNAFTGLFSTSNRYSLALSIKHILIIIMTGLALVRTKLVVRATKPLTRATQKRGAIMIVCNIALGIAVLLLSAYTATIANMPIS
ncbi:MAG: hypothetical protein IAX21_01995 [Candidatus Bathyarchaeota archaeon]|nr:hypothetical protein [Candidatus Bathyarchaeum tardum]WGM90254.1 MAG: hypothetical protein NUK63_03810 [Candidatus Bathyarchaeum tardum]WNZ29667.1 MAG: hypothetical protein IAX21_01995 [Candidatus Bathyarchaeota archaeon]